MEKIYVQLEEIKRCPGMYLGRKSLVRLSSYIRGYLDSECNRDKNYLPSFIHFNDYVKNYFDLSTDNDWEKIILFYTSTEEDAVDMFYKILNDFFLKIKES